MSGLGLLLRICSLSALGAASAQSVDLEFKVNLGGKDQKEASFKVRVHPDWAPKGAEQFLSLVKKGWYDDCGVFRVVPGFVAQFGLPAEPQDELDPIEDDEVTQSNKRGTIVFATAGPNTRTSQLFINYGDNSFLDQSGFSPFGEVLGDGMEIVDKFNSEYGEEPDQGKITKEGNEYLDKEFPRLAHILKVSILEQSEIHQ